MNQEALLRQQKVEMDLLKDFEMTLHRGSESVKKKLANVKVRNVSLRWSRGGVDEKVRAFEKNVGVSSMAEAASAQQIVSQFVHSVQTANSEH